ncbi:MAG: hypothetical protein NTX43_10365 [Bacteroidetes bacterium]|nr:hypothetical protein [Bacteroidota bacterium]
MKRALFTILSLVFLLGCSKSSTDSTSEFSNSLTFGTGLNPSNLFQLTGVGTVFQHGSTIYFRLESQDDMGGSTVKIQINKSDGSAYNSFTFTNPQSYGHILLSSFSIPDVGAYTAIGILVTGSKTVASSPLTIQ